MAIAVHNTELDTAVCSINRPVHEYSKIQLVRDRKRMMMLDAFSVSGDCKDRKAKVVLHSNTTDLCNNKEYLPLAACDPALAPHHTSPV